MDPSNSLGGMRMNETTMNMESMFYSQYLQLKGHNKLNEEFVENLIKQNLDLCHQVKDLKEKIETGCDHHDIVAKYIRATAAPFVSVIIDGNTMPLHHQYIQTGFSGGRAAAQAIHREIAARVFPSSQAPEDMLKILCHFYLDVQATVEEASQAGIPNASLIVDEFIHGFSSTYIDFEILNIRTSTSSGISTTDKIEALIAHHYFDLRCKEMYLGFGQNDRLAKDLEVVSFDKNDSIKLLVGLPLPAEYDRLPFERVRIDSVFRTTIYPVNYIQGLNSPTFGPPGLSRQTSSAPSERVVTPAPAVPVASGTWAATVKASIEKNPEHVNLSLARTNSSSRPGTPSATLRNKSENVPPPPRNRTAHASTSSSISVPPTQPSNANLVDDLGIKRNDHGHRIDPPRLKNYEREQVTRIKSLKVCNAHYLRPDGCTKKGDSCQHKHNWQPRNGSDDLEALKMIARMSPCQNGPTCRDKHCIYGHQCTAPKAERGTKAAKDGFPCMFGEDCYFTTEMHGIY